MRSKEILVIKGKFEAPQSKNYGLIFLVYNQSNATIENISVIVSLFSELYNLPLNMSWLDFEARIKKDIFKGQYLQKQTIDLQKTCKSLMLDDFFISNFIDMITQKNTKGLRNIISESLSKQLHEARLKLDIALDEVSLQDMTTAYGTYNPQEDQLNVEDDHTIEGIILNANCFLDPIAGTSLANIKIGDRIFIKIFPDTDRANYFIDFYKLRYDKGIKPLPATIQVLKRLKKNIEMTLKIEESLFCKVMEEANVMVKVATNKDTIESVSQTTVAKKTTEVMNNTSKTSTSSNKNNVITPTAKSQQSTKATSSMTIPVFITIAFIIILGITFFAILGS